MSVVSKNTIKSYFVAGNTPHEGRYIDLADSYEHKQDPVLTKGNVSIQNNEVKVGTNTMTSTGFTAGNTTVKNDEVKVGNNKLTSTELALNTLAIKVGGVSTGMLTTPQAAPNIINILTYKEEFTSRQWDCIEAIVGYITNIRAILINHNIAYQQGGGEGE